MPGFALRAQDNLRTDGMENLVYIGTGIEPTWDLTLGYQRPMKIGRCTMYPYAEWHPSVVRFGFRNWNSKLGMRYRVIQKGAFAVINNTLLSPGRVETRNFNSFKIAISDRILIGLFDPRKYLAFSAEYKKIVLSHIHHTAYYREVFYEDAHDGWYKSTGGMVQFGLEGGFSIGNRWSATIDLKMPLTEKFTGYGGSPANINILIAYKL